MLTINIAGKSWANRWVASGAVIVVLCAMLKPGQNRQIALSTRQILQVSKWHRPISSQGRIEKVLGTGYNNCCRPITINLHPNLIFTRSQLVLRSLYIVVLFYTYLEEIQFLEPSISSIRSVKLNTVDSRKLLANYAKKGNTWWGNSFTVGLLVI